jgi:tight adherence protein B
LILGLGVSSALAAGDAVRIREVDTSRFPLVTMTVSVQGAGTLTPADVQIEENGRGISATDVSSLGLSSTTLDVVLAIDTSNSMRGGPLATAYAAASSFAAQVPPWVRIGLITFASEPVVRVSPTTDRAVLSQELSTPPATSAGTALFDTVVAASNTFSGEGQRNVVLLTDGRNTVGATDLDAAVQTALDSHVTLFTVGLEQAQTDAPILKRLAQLTDGAYTAASQEDLDGAYRSLAAQLSEQYVITYRSRAPFGASISISVDLPQGSDEAGILAPAPRGSLEAAPEGALSRFLEGEWGLVAVTLICFATFLLVFDVTIGRSIRTRRRRELAARMSVTRPVPTVPVREQKSPLTSWIPQPLVGAAEQAAQSSRWGKRLETALERAGLPVRRGEFVAGTLLAMAAGAALGALLFRNPALALVLASFAGLIPRILLSSAVSKRTQRFQDQLPDLLMVLASSLRAGHSFMQALDTVTKELDDPASTEFARAITEIRLGRQVDAALEATADRAGSEDFRWAVMAINIQRQAGGNLAEILETVADTIRARETIRRQIKVLSAEGRLSVAILFVLPFLIGFYIYMVNPAYLSVLFDSVVGISMLITTGVLMVIGFVWMKRIVNLDV